MKRLFLYLFLLPALAQAQPVKVITSVAGTATGGGGFVAERTIRVNFGSQYTSAAPSGWNAAYTDVSAINTDVNTYNSGNLTTDAGAATTIYLTVPNHFSITSAASAPVPATANSGLYQDVVVGSSWIMNTGDPDPGVQVNNLNASKYYVFYIMGNSESYRNALTYWYVGATQSATINQVNNYGSSLDAETTSTALALVKNITGTTTALIRMHQASGAGAGWNTLVIMEGSSAMAMLLPPHLSLPIAFSGTGAHRGYTAVVYDKYFQEPKKRTA